METKNRFSKRVTVKNTASGKGAPSEHLTVRAVTIANEFPTPRAPQAAWVCVGQDPDLFHPEDLDGLAQAAAVCAPCPMREACLALGLDRKEWGVWGGVLLENGKRLTAPRTPGRPSRPAPAAAEAVAVA